MPEPLNPRIKTKFDEILLIPFGGLGQFGANMMGLYLNKKLYLIDCGVSFPDARKLGVDAVVPDCMSFIESLGGVSAYFITHGHEDHIGALPIFYRFFQAPIFATPWTAEMIENKFQRYGYDKSPKVTVTDYKNEFKHDGLLLRWIYMTHSLPEASSLFIKTPFCNIFHSGDFKLDPDPIVGPLTDFSSLKDIAKEGVDIMLCDSTNANKPGRTGTEKSTEQPLAKILKGTEGKVFLTCFSSNVARIQSAINACRIAGRKLCLIGNSLEQTFFRALEHKLITNFQDITCTFDEAKYLEKSKVCFLLTGSQGEYRGALARLVYGEMRELSIEPNDVILFSSRIIPGNEKTVLNLMNEIERLGAHSVTNRLNPDIHVSGHAHSEEIVELMELLKPNLFLPVHGSYMHLNSNLDLGKKSAPRVLEGFVENGEIIKFNKALKVERLHKLEFERLFVDAFSKALMPAENLRERLRVGEHGMVLVTGSFSAKKKKWIGKPEISLVGLGETMFYSKEDVIEQTLDAIYKYTKKMVIADITQHTLREELRVITRRVMHTIYGRKPVAMSMVHLAD